MNLNDLFSQILQSEHKAQEKKKLLCEVKNEIIKVQEQLKEAQEDCVSSQGQLVVKQQHQADAELSLVWMKHREVILANQLTQVTQERETTAQKLQSLKAAEIAKHNDFIKEVANFNQYYDLNGEGMEHREAKAKQRIQELKHEEDRLLAELSDYRKAQAVGRRLNTEKEQLEDEIDTLDYTLKELQKELEHKSSLTVQLARTRDEVASLPQNDPEFIRLRSKLEACRSEGLETLCHSLQQEADRLQRQHWQRQLQRQANKTGSSQSTEARSSSNHTQKVQKQQDVASTDSFSNSWSNLRINHPSSSLLDESTSGHDQQITAPLTKPNPAGISIVTQSSTDVIVKKELPFQSGGEKDNKNKTTKFNFRHLTPYSKSSSSSKGFIQSSSDEAKLSGIASCIPGKDDKNGDAGARGNSGLTQLPEIAKKVRFKH